MPTMSPMPMAAHRKGSIGGTAYCDNNRNGSFDTGDVALSGVTITLSTGAAAITATDGSYTFTGLAAGAYTVSAPASVSGKSLSTGSPIPVALASGESRRNVTFGYAASTVSISGSVYNDLNCDGTRNPANDLGVSGVTVRLFSGATQAASLSTDGTGTYNFKNLAPGTYLVTISVPSGSAEKKAIAGIGGAVVNNTTITVTASSAGAYSGQMFLICGAAGFTTYSQCGWGSQPNGNNPASLLARSFPTVYPGGLTLGGTCTLRLTSQLAAQAYLPSGGAVNYLKKNYVNPTTTEAGVFGAQVTALQFNVDFSNQGITKPGLVNLKMAPNNRLAGWTVGQILGLAKSVLGGATSALPKGTSISDLNDIVDKINKNFDNGTRNGGYLVP